MIWYNIYFRDLVKNIQTFSLGAAEMRTAAAAAFNGSEAATAAMNGGQDRKRKKPDFSMEWKDLKIEIKVYGKVNQKISFLLFVSKAF